MASRRTDVATKAAKPVARAKAAKSTTVKSTTARPATARSTAARSSAAKSTPARATTAPRSLDTAEIVRAARSLVARYGLEELSMRALARELGVSHMAAYHHVGSKVDLLALIIDDVLKQIEVPAPDSGTWQERIRELNLRSSWAVATVPGLEKVMFSIRPTQQGWRLIDGYVSLLLEAGFTERQAALGFGLLHSYGMGRTGLETQLRSSSLENREPLEGPALERIDNVWPQLHRADYRQFALEVMIAGLEAILAGRDIDSVAPSVAPVAKRSSARAASGSAAKGAVGS
jgi:TetR/AcrR family transcriptional regulator, tetracycline repressor protein